MSFYDVMKREPLQQWVGLSPHSGKVNEKEKGKLVEEALKGILEARDKRYYIVVFKEDGSKEEFVEIPKIKELAERLARLVPEDAKAQALNQKIQAIPITDFDWKGMPLEVGVQLFQDADRATVARVDQWGEALADKKCEIELGRAARSVGYRGANPIRREQIYNAVKDGRALYSEGIFPAVEVDIKGIVESLRDQATFKEKFIALLSDPSLSRKGLDLILLIIQPGQNNPEHAQWSETMRQIGEELLEQGQLPDRAIHLIPFFLSVGVAREGVINYFTSVESYREIISPLNTLFFEEIYFTKYLLEEHKSPDAYMSEKDALRASNFAKIEDLFKIAMAVDQPRLYGGFLLIAASSGILWGRKETIDPTLLDRINLNDNISGRDVIRAVNSGNLPFVEWSLNKTITSWQFKTERETLKDILDSYFRTTMIEEPYRHIEHNWPTFSVEHLPPFIDREKFETELAQQIKANTREALRLIWNKKNLLD